MKYTLHIPTEQFGFVGVEYESEKSIDPAIVYERYREVADAFKPKPVNEMPAKEFNEILDEYLATNQLANGGDFYENLSPAQKYVINEIKKSRKRTN